MNDLQRYLAEELAEDYREGRLPRRKAMKLIAGLTGTVLATRMLGASAQTGPAAPPAAAARSPSVDRVAADDPAVAAGPVRFPGRGAALLGYLARPTGAGAHPIVLVCHENRGLTGHIEDVTRRLAKAGYVGLAVDLLSREGGTAKLRDDDIPGLLGKAPATQPVEDFESGLAYVKAQPFARADRAGMVGFCYGGGVTWRVAAAVPELRAAVPYYGQPVSPAEIPRIHAAVLAIYAGRDQRIDATIPATEASMRQNGKTFRAIVYPDVDHAFNNDTIDRFDAAAAKAAWQETRQWLARYLQSA